MYKKNDKVKRDELHELVKEYNGNFGNRIKNIPLLDGQKVMFDPTSKVSRTQFKKDYPNNKIVYSVDQADVIIVPDYFEHTYNTREIFKEDYTASSWRTNYLEEISLTHIGQIRKANEVLFKSQVFKSNKIIILDKVISTSGLYGRKMTIEEREQIGNLLSAADAELNTLGYTLLLAFDPVQNEEEYVLALARSRNYYQPSTRIFKQIKKKIKEKYINLR